MVGSGIPFTEVVKTTEEYVQAAVPMAASHAVYKKMAVIYEELESITVEQSK